MDPPRLKPPQRPHLAVVEPDRAPDRGADGATELYRALRRQRWPPPPPKPTVRAPPLVRERLTGRSLGAVVEQAIVDRPKDLDIGRTLFRAARRVGGVAIAVAGVVALIALLGLAISLTGR